MDVAGQLSNPVSSLSAELPKIAARGKRVRRSKPMQFQRRLSEAERRELVLKYNDGSSQLQLAREFGVHRTTVMDLLDRAGASRRPVSTAQHKIAQMPELYRQGWSSARIGEFLGVDPKTVIRYLISAGVEIRPRRGWA